MKTRREGLTSVLVVIALLALAGAAAMSIDVGRLMVAAGQCRNVADAAALAGARQLPDATPTRAACMATVDANNASSPAMAVTCDADDVTLYGPDDTIANGDVLGPWAHAVRVQVRIPVEYTFARLLGINGAVARRDATAVRGPCRGAPITTMWIANPTDTFSHEPMNLLMADGPHYAGVPGSFGFLTEPDGCTADWFTLLQGYGLTHEDVDTAFVQTGDSVYAKTGVDVGAFRKALETDQGHARLERCMSEEWADDVPEPDGYQYDNPRIMIVPLVSYVGDTGTNAEFCIERFGAFWVDEVHAGQKEIVGRFIEYSWPGGDPDTSLQNSTGIFATQLVD